MISHDLQCVFVHVHKTGGNSVHAALAPHASETFVRKKGFEDLYDGLELKEYPKHDHLSAYAARLGPERFADYFKFACVRDPWDRALSWFLWAARDKGWGDFDPARFREWLESYRHLVSATEMMSVDGELAVDAVMRFESLARDFGKVLVRLGLTGIDLPRTNVTPGRRRYVDYYDDTTRSLVAERFADDVENFGYEFGGTHVGTEARRDGVAERR